MERKTAEALLERFYDMSKPFETDIFADDFVFRGSIMQRELAGIPAYMAYRRALQAAFPDWQNRMVEYVFDGTDRVVARVEWTGTHTGAPLLDIAPSGRAVRYRGICWFQLDAALGKVKWAEVYGEIDLFLRQLRGEADI